MGSGCGTVGRARRFQHKRYVVQIQSVTTFIGILLALIKKGSIFNKTAAICTSASLSIFSAFQTILQQKNAKNYLQITGFKLMTSIEHMSQTLWGYNIRKHNYVARVRASTF